MTLHTNTMHMANSVHQVNDVFVFLLTIKYVLKDSSGKEESKEVRFSNQYENFISRTLTFSPRAFEVSLPGNGTGVPRIALNIDDVDHVMTDIVRGAVYAPEVTIEVVTNIFPDQVERQYSKMEIISSESDGKGTMRLQMTLKNLLNRKFPRESYDVIDSVACIIYSLFSVANLNVGYGK